MRAQAVLTPTESKKLIAKAVARMDVVTKALKDGIIVMHPSSSTYFIVEELTGHRPRTNAWVCGMVIPKGLCVEMGMSATVKEPREEGKPIGGGDDFRASWVIRKGEITSGIPLAPVLKEMGPEDVYIKGVNALDTQGRVGVLIGSQSPEVVTIGRVMAARRERGINVIFAVGLEKLIPIPMEEAAQEAKQRPVDYSMGCAPTLFACDGTVVTELEAINILSGAVATPIAAGGLGGAEGAIILMVKGNEEQVGAAINYIEQSKGARLPSVRTANCNDCWRTWCAFPVGDKHWAV